MPRTAGIVLRDASSAQPRPSVGGGLPRCLVSPLARTLVRRELRPATAPHGASFKAARTLAKDEITSFLREPFVKGAAHEGEDEEPVEGGMEQAIGELVTCSRCIGTWAAAGLAVTQVIAPRFGRLLTWSLGAAAVNDFLQSGFTALAGKATELEG